MLGNVLRTDVIIPFIKIKYVPSLDRIKADSLPFILKQVNIPSIFKTEKLSLISQTIFFPVSLLTVAKLLQKIK